MEIINKKHEEYYPSLGVHKAYISFSKDMRIFRINTAATKEFKLKAGSYLHFVSDYDRLYIFFNDDNSGAMACKNRDNGLMFWAYSLLNLLAQKNKHIRGSSKYLLRKSNTRIQDCLTLEVLIHNRVLKTTI